MGLAGDFWPKTLENPPPIWPKNGPGRFTVRDCNAACSGGPGPRPWGQVVSPVVAEGFARAHGMEFFQLSSLQRSEVEQPFQHIAHAFYRSYEAKLKAREGHWKPQARPSTPGIPWVMSAWFPSPFSQQKRISLLSK